MKKLTHEKIAEETRSFQAKGGIIRKEEAASNVLKLSALPLHPELVAPNGWLASGRFFVESRVDLGNGLPSEGETDVIELD